VRQEGLGQLKKISNLIGTRTVELPACSLAHQPSTIPRAPLLPFVGIKAQLSCSEVSVGPLNFLSSTNSRNNI
jgi:hypothetical protein